MKYIYIKSNQIFEHFFSNNLVALWCKTIFATEEVAGLQINQYEDKLFTFFSITVCMCISNHTEHQLINSVKIYLARLEIQKNFVYEES